MDDVADWLGFGALALGATALLVGIVTGRLRLTNSPESIEQRLARFPASAGAVVIKGQPKKAGWRMGAAVLFAVGLAFTMPYVQRSGLPFLCNRLSPAEAAHWTLLLYFPVLPALLAAIASLEVYKAIRVLRGGYSPPLSSVMAQDTVAVTGWRAKLHGVLGLLVMPVLVLWVALLAYDTRQSFDASKLQTHIAAKCSAPPR